MPHTHEEPVTVTFDLTMLLAALVKSTSAATLMLLGTKGKLVVRLNLFVNGSELSTVVDRVSITDGVYSSVGLRWTDGSITHRYYIEKIEERWVAQQEREVIQGL